MFNFVIIIGECHAYPLLVKKIVKRAGRYSCYVTYVSEA